MWCNLLDLHLQFYHLILDILHNIKIRILQEYINNRELFIMVFMKLKEN